MNTDALSIQRAVEDRWKDRAEMQGFKPGSKKYLTAQAEFFGGAMTAMQFIFGNNLQTLADEIPPKWVICIMSGRDIINPVKVPA